MCIHRRRAFSCFIRSKFCWERGDSHHFLSWERMRTERKYAFDTIQKRYYAGFTFTENRFGLKDSMWFVGAERAKDGAMDVFFALPVDIQFLGKSEGAKKENTIDELIRNAEKQLE